MELVIYGKPTGKARPRINTYTHRAYTPQKTLDYEEYIRTLYVNKYSIDIEPTTKALECEIRAYFKIPSSLSKRQKQWLKSQPYTHKPDIDNISKIILDSLNGLAYKDDNQVVKLNVEKWYTEEDERVEIIIKEYSNEN